MTPPAPAPRLCYLGSVPVEPSSAGMMLLHRLLSAYPAEQLAIGYTPEAKGVLSSRTPAGVHSFVVPKAFYRGWVFTRRRAPRLHLTLLRVHAEYQAALALRRLKGFMPQAVLTVHDRFGVLAAAALARRLGAPLHLILHDEWFRDVPAPPATRRQLEGLFGQLYRNAASRLCVSPYMEQDYFVRYGARGTVLYPYRAKDATPAAEPPLQVALPEHPLTVAYGGTVCSTGYWNALRALADALAPVGGKLLIFGPKPAEVAAQGLARDHVSARGFSPNLMAAMRAEANVLFLPMAFEASEEANARVSFPSKLTEYTATGLPLLIYGPPYASALRWASSHPGSAEVVDQPGAGALRDPVRRLLDPQHRVNLARHALNLGAKYFDFQRAYGTFLGALQGGPA